MCVCAVDGGGVAFYIYKKFNLKAVFCFLFLFVCLFCFVVFVVAVFFVGVFVLNKQKVMLRNE